MLSWNSANFWKLPCSLLAIPTLYNVETRNYACTRPTLFGGGGGEGLVPVSALKNICIDVMTLCQDWNWICKKIEFFEREFVNVTAWSVDSYSCFMFKYLRLFQLRQRQNLCPIQYIFLYSSCDSAQSHLNVQGSGRRQSTSGLRDKDRECAKCRKLP